MAGRPKGSKNLPQIRDYLNRDEIDKLVDLSYKKAVKDGDSLMQKFLLEQVFGKAKQNIDFGDGEGDNVLLVKFVNGKQDTNNRDGNTE